MKSVLIHPPGQGPSLVQGPFLVQARVDISGLEDQPLGWCLIDAFRVMLDPACDPVRLAQANELVRETVRQKRTPVVQAAINKLQEMGDDELHRTAVTALARVTGTAEALCPHGRLVVRTFSVGLHLHLGKGGGRAFAQRSWKLPRDITNIFRKSIGGDDCVAFSLAPSLYRPWEFECVTATEVLAFTEKSLRLVTAALKSDTSFSAPELVAPRPYRGGKTPDGGPLWAVFAGALAVQQGGSTLFPDELEGSTLIPAHKPKAGYSPEGWGRKFVARISPLLKRAIPGLVRVGVLGSGTCAIVAQDAVIRDNYPPSGFSP